MIDPIEGAGSAGPDPQTTANQEMPADGVTVHVYQLDANGQFLETPMIPAPPGPLGLRPIESVRIAARVCFNPYMTWSVGEGNITLHFSCGTNPEFWANISLDTEQLGELLCALIEEEDGAGPNHLLRGVLRSLVRKQA